MRYAAEQRAFDLSVPGDPAWREAVEAAVAMPAVGLVGHGGRRSRVSVPRASILLLIIGKGFGG